MRFAHLAPAPRLSCISTDVAVFNHLGNREYKPRYFGDLNGGVDLALHSSGGHHEDLALALVGNKLPSCTPELLPGATPGAFTDFVARQIQSVSRMDSGSGVHRHFNLDELLFLVRQRIDLLVQVHAAVEAVQSTWSFATQRLLGGDNDCSPDSGQSICLNIVIQLLLGLVVTLRLSIFNIFIFFL